MSSNCNYEIVGYVFLEIIYISTVVAISASCCGQRLNVLLSHYNACRMLLLKCYYQN